MEKHSRDFVKTSIIYLVLIITVYWTLQEPRVFSFQVDYRNTTEIDFSVFCWPIISLLLGLYLGRAVEYVFTGRWVRPLKLCLRYAGVISLIYLSLSSPQAPASLRFTSTIFLTGTGAMTLLLLIENTVAQEHRLIKYIVKASRYLVFGATGWLLVSRIPEIAINGLADAFLLTGVLTAAVAFTGYLEDWSIAYLSAIGERLGSRMRLSFTLVSFLSLYATVFRQYLIRGLAQSAGFVYLMEWSGVSLLVFIVYRRLRIQLKQGTSDIKGNWTTHIQEIETRSDTELTRWSQLVDDYIMDGEKNLLILFLADLLRRNGVSLEQTQVILSQLMNWREHDQNIGLAHREAQRQRLLQDQRGAVLDQVIVRIQEKIG